MSFNFNRNVDYALVALASLAMPEVGDQAKGEAGVSRFLSAQQIAADRGLPPRMLTNVLKRLHRGGLIKSRRGAGGGYWLARSAEKIRVAEVLEVMQGPVRINPCCGEDEANACLACQAAPKCPITRSIRQLNQKVVAVLEGVTIADLLRDSAGEEGRRWRVEPVVLGRSAVQK